MSAQLSRRRALRPLSPVLAALLAAPGLASAQAAPVAADSTITVTATRTPVRLAESISEVTVLDRAALDRAQGRTLAELLSQQAGLQFSSNGGLGKTASVFMRGLESRHTLLLVDGVRVGSATLGTPSLDNLPLESIERIEIVRGPMSSLYGAGAMGGVIQVFTKKGQRGFTANAGASAGSEGYGQLTGGAAWGDGRFDAAVQLQRTRVDGPSASNPQAPFGNHNEDDDGFRQSGGSLRLGWNLAADWRVEALALQSRGTTQVDDGPGADARARLSNRVLALSASGTVMPGWRSRVSVAGSTDGYDTLRSASPWTDLGLIESRIRQSGWENTVATPLGTALVLLERQTETVSRPGEPFSVQRRHIDGLALGLNGAEAAHAWQASWRHDRNSQFGTHATGAAGYSYALTPAWRLAASAGTSFVAPSFNQLYYPAYGNPLLEPETGRHAELGLRWKGQGQGARLAWYGHTYRGFITSGAAPVNLPRARITGLTLAWDARWGDWTLAASADHTNPRNDTVGNANQGKRLPRRAEDALRLAADWQGGAWAAGATLAAFSARWDDAANTVRLAGYATLDLRAEWSATRDWTLGLKLNNALDQHYQTSLGYDQPRRGVFVNARYTLK